MSKTTQVSSPIVLLLSDDPGLHAELRQALAGVDIELLVAGDVSAAQGLLLRAPPSVVVAEHSSWIELIERAKRTRPSLACLIYSREDRPGFHSALDLPVLGRPAPPAVLRQLLLDVIALAPAPAIEPG